MFLGNLRNTCSNHFRPVQSNDKLDKCTFRPVGCFTGRRARELAVKVVPNAHMSNEVGIVNSVIGPTQFGVNISVMLSYNFGIFK